MHQNQTKPIKTLFVLSSCIGKAGHYGNRAERLLSAFDTRTVGIICRKSYTSTGSAHIFELPIFSQMASFLNVLRRLVYTGFNNRRIELALFELLVFSKLKYIDLDNVSCVHLFEPLPRLAKFLKKNNIVVIIDTPNAPFSYVKKLHDEGFAKCLNYFEWQDRQERKLFHLADHIIAPSEFVSDEISNISSSYKPKISVIPFGANIPTDNEASSIEEQSQEPGSFTALFVGNVDGRKGFYELCEVFNEPIFSKDKLLVCGRATKASLNLIAQSPAITYIGFVDPTPYYKSADCFILPSWSEGSSKVIYEAAAFGLPVITTHSSGSVLEDGVSCMLVQPGDLVSLRKAIMTMRDNVVFRRKVGSAAKRMIKYYSWQNYADNVLATHKELMDK